MLTYDQGKEMAWQKELTKRLSMEVFFADLHSPWQSGRNENKKGLIRSCLPKGDDRPIYSQAYLSRIAKALNDRPGAVLGLMTPAEAMTEEINKVRNGAAPET